jgi:hypothetical protein
VAVVVEAPELLLVELEVLVAAAVLIMLVAVAVAATLVLVGLALVVHHRLAVALKVEETVVLEMQRKCMALEAVVVWVLAKRVVLAVLVPEALSSLNTKRPK